MRTLLAVAAGLVVLVIATTPAAGVTERAVTEARISVPSDTAAIGQQIPVGLTGWPVGTVHIELCGGQARRGSLDCASGSAVQVYIPASGTANARLAVVRPPVDCPCVVRVSSLTGSVVRTAGVALTGVPAGASARAERPAQLRLAELVIIDSGGRAAQFAFPTQLTLRLVLHNEGPTPAVDPVISLLAGRADRVTTIVSPPQLGTIPAGEARTYLLRVPLAVPVFGRYVVSGQIDGGDRPVAFVAEAASYPWGLLAVVGALMLLLLVRRRR